MSGPRGACLEKFRRNYRGMCKYTHYTDSKFQYKISSLDDYDIKGQNTSLGHFIKKNPQI